MTVTLTVNQMWWMIKALRIMTSPAGEAQLRAEYPNMDVQAVADTVLDLTKTLEKGIKG